LLQKSLGGGVNGTLRQYSVFEESGLMHMLQNLTFNSASTLPCAAVTAWNALYRLPGILLEPDDTMLTQGIGGISTFALRFAVAAGAIVIATTSSADEEEILENSGAHYVINYKQDRQWENQLRILQEGKRMLISQLSLAGPPPSNNLSP
jgi:NADPH:quinone reductase-like Zn-dependent oxidoreductase